MFNSWLWVQLSFRSVIFNKCALAPWCAVGLWGVSFISPLSATWCTLWIVKKTQKLLLCLNNLWKSLKISALDYFSKCSASSVLGHYRCMHVILYFWVYILEFYLNFHNFCLRVQSFQHWWSHAIRVCTLSCYRVAITEVFLRKDLCLTFGLYWY